MKCASMRDDESAWFEMFSDLSSFVELDDLAGQDVSHAGIEPDEIAWPKVSDQHHSSDNFNSHISHWKAITIKLGLQLCWNHKSYKNVYRIKLIKIKLYWWWWKGKYLTSIIRPINIIVTNWHFWWLMWNRNMLWNDSFSTPNANWLTELQKWYP